MNLFSKKKKEVRGSRFKQAVNHILFDNHSRSGKIFDVFLTIFILVGILVVMLESVADLRYKYGEIFAIIEWTVVIFFTVEFVFRIYSAENKKKYLTSFYGVIDVISIAPVYLAIFLPSVHYLVLFRAFRIIRVFRVFKMLPLVKEQSTLTASIRNSIPKIMIFLTFTFISSIVFASIMYIVEGEAGGFIDIPTSLYWTIVTITTVGYGDITPLTTAGKIIASVIMLSGYGVIAVPTGIVVSEYNKASKDIDV